MQDLELVGWWVGQPLLERDFGTRLHLAPAALAADGALAEGERVAEGERERAEPAAAAATLEP